MKVLSSSVATTVEWRRSAYLMVLHVLLLQQDESWLQVGYLMGEPADNHLRPTYLGHQV